MNKEETGKILLTIAGIYPNWKMNEMTAPIWQKLLAEVPYEMVGKALEKYLSQAREYAPTPGQLLEILRNEAKSEADRLTADEAWEMAVNAAKRGKLDGITHEKTLAIIRQVGFDRIRHADIETQLPFVRRDFVDAFNRTSVRDEAIRQALAPTEEVRGIVGALTGKRALTH